MYGPAASSSCGPRFVAARETGDLLRDPVGTDGADRGTVSTGARIREPRWTYLPPRWKRRCTLLPSSGRRCLVGVLCLSSLLWIYEGSLDGVVGGARPTREGILSSAAAAGSSFRFAHPGPALLLCSHFSSRVGGCRGIQRRSWDRLQLQPSWPPSCLGLAGLPPMVGSSGRV